MTIFLPKKKRREKKLRPPDWPQLRQHGGQETDFFVDSLVSVMVFLVSNALRRLSILRNGSVASVESKGQGP